MKKLILTLAYSLLSGGILFAAKPEIPILWTCGYINGAMNIVVSNNVNAAGYEVQMKLPQEEAWQTIDGELGRFSANNIFVTVWHKTFYYVGTPSFRIRACNAEGTSDWLSVGEHKATINVRGTIIGNIGNDDPGDAFDGDLSSMIDATVNFGDDAWVGYLFDQPTAIRAVRFLPRMDHDKLANRYRDSFFQAAANGSFSDPQDLYRVPSDYTLPRQISEITFDPPITATAFRHWKAKGGYEQSAELEFIPAGVPFRLSPELSETSEDQTFFPIISCTFQPGFNCSSCIVERAFYPEGPWGISGEWIVATGETICITNRRALVGIPTYYHLRAVTEHPDYQGEEVVSPSVFHTRVRRLERDPQNEAEFLEGVTLMKATNGDDLPGAERAFDGNVSTFPDFCNTEIHYRGPLGVNFGEPAWVKKIGYVCRNDNWCYSRLQKTALFCASGNDIQLNDKVQVSELIQKVSQDTTFYTQETENLPEDGADCYFLWAPGTNSGDDYFFGNVAEVCFFGWSQSDLNQLPVVSSPKNFVISKENGFPELTWSVAKNANDYAIQRRIQGTTEWELRAAGVRETNWADSLETTQLNTAYEYRVIANGGELGSAPSDISLIYLYEQGNGSGLRGYAMWPYHYDSASIDQLTNGYEIAPGRVGFASEKNQEVFPGVTNNFRVSWSGEISVPVNGSYTFTLDTMGLRGAVQVNQISVANEWKGDAPVTGSITLEKGTYPIRVEIRTSSTAEARQCKLHWSGPMPMEEIPLSQLIPSAEPPINKINEWTCYVFGGDYAGFFRETNPNQYEIRFSGGSPSGWNDLYQMAFLGQHLHGSYEFETKIQMRYSGSGAILARDDVGHMIAFEVIKDPSDQILHRMRVFLPGEQNSRFITDTIRVGHLNDYKGVIKLTREGGCFTGWYKLSPTDSEWIQLAQWPEADHPEQKLGGDLYWGMASWGGDRRNLVTSTFTDPTIKPIMRGTVIILQ